MEVKIGKAPIPLDALPSYADACMKNAEDALKKYIRTKISDYVSISAFADATGIPRNTIQSTLHKGQLLGLKLLAYRIQTALQKQQEKTNA